MSVKLVTRPRARTDEAQIGDYLLRMTLDLALAERWVDAVQNAARYAAEYPAQTPIIDFVPVTDFGPLRRRILGNGFQRYLLFYRFAGEAVTVIRILHGSRDWASVPDL